MVDHALKLDTALAVHGKVEMIKEVIKSTRATHQPLPKGITRLPELSSYWDSPYLPDSLDINEVFPNVFITDEDTAKKKSYLHHIGVTHVVNAAEGMLLGYVNTSAQYYAGTGIAYKGIPLADLGVSDASQYFVEVADFIDAALKAGGRVLIHCFRGVSRSGTLLLAYLMLKQGMSAVEATRAVRMIRNIHPNDGFIWQLAKLDNKLGRKNSL